MWVGPGLAEGDVGRAGPCGGDVGESGLAEGLWLGPALRGDCGVAVPGCVIVLVAAARVKGAFGVAGAIFDP
jgi:hypothetical protein